MPHLGKSLTWVDAKDNVYPRKDREQNKIDGPVAHMMAQARWMLAEGGPDLDEFLKDPVMYA